MAIELTTAEAATYLKISEKKLRAMRARDDGPPFALRVAASGAIVAVYDGDALNYWLVLSRANMKGLRN